ncbi:amidase family protein [Streptomyces sp. NPDC090052]|uniref:amidase family protein n=1 Tax=Streptomyces sp. NPDC090052 TaxID=3365931 RepID=UPI00382447A8
MNAAVAEALGRIARLDPALSAFTEVWPDAPPGGPSPGRPADHPVDGGPPRSGVPLSGVPLSGVPLSGVPFAVKGPSGIRGYAARRLRAAGAVPVGSTAVPGPGTHWQTWGLGAHGPTRNPWRPDRTPGGSSAGSAVAVATGMVPLATGSDGAGSVRIPAAWCGVLGLRTTAGLLPSPDRTGLASAGVLAAGADRAQAYLRAVTGRYEPSLPEFPVPAVWSADLGFAAVDDEVERVARRAVERMAAAGLVRLDATSYDLLDPCDAWLAVRGGQPDLAAAVRAENDHRLASLFARTPLLLTPVTPNRPHGHEGPGERYSTSLTWAFNLSGHPAASIPAGFGPDGCPVGLQIVAAPGQDASLVEMARAAESIMERSAWSASPH